MCIPKKQQHKGKTLFMKNALTTMLCLLLWAFSIPDSAGASEKAMKRVSKLGHGDWEQPITLEEGAEGVLRARLVPSVISTVTPPRSLSE
ncbi:MAG: hypothetical protein GY807_04190, partial [Gammaproteobacteria bacterium]|nr:hypothetical protein [Gammaproteobacteria bacterium]